MSYTGVSEEEYGFELLSIGADFQYVALGTSDDGSMGDDNVVICRDVPSNQVQAYYNVDTTNGPVLLSDPSYGITDPSTQRDGDSLYCSFTRPANMSVLIPPEDTLTLDQNLNDLPYYILLAQGELDGDGNPLQHSTSDRYATEEPIELVEFNSFQDTFYVGCGDTKGCFGTPEGCLDTKTCDIAVTYTGNTAGSYDFVLRGPLNEFVAFGLSDDQVMSNDSVVACISFTDVDGVVR